MIKMKHGKQVNIILFILLSICLLTFSCKDQISIAGFDAGVWSSDRSGCAGRRQGEIKVLLDSKDKLLGINERRIMNFLGTPDRNDLYKRRQKFYIYYVDSGPDCVNVGTEHEMLIIRFNATGYSNEVFLQNGFTTK